MERLAIPLRHTLPTRLLAVLLWTVVAGCDADGVKAPSDAPPPDEIEAVPFETTKILSSSDLEALDRSEPDGRLVFTSVPPALVGVAPGDIILAGQSPTTPHGLLRVVTSVDAWASDLTLSTLNAPVQLAFRKLHVRVQRSVPSIVPEASARERVLSPASFRVLDGPGGSLTKTQRFDFPLFDGDGDADTRDDRVELSGELGGALDYTMQLDFDWGEIDRLPEAVVECISSVITLELECSFDALLPEAKLSFDTQTRLSADATVSGAAIADFEVPFPIFPAQALAEIPLGPLVLAPVLEINAQVTGGASGSFSAGVHASVDVVGGVDLSSKRLGAPNYRAPEVSNLDLSADDPEVTLEARARASIEAKLSLLLYNVAGPSASASVYAGLMANPFGKPCWALEGGVGATMGVTLSPTLPFVGQVTLFDWQAPPFSLVDEPLLEGTCTAPENTSTLPPGSGPDSERYARPSFEPWSQLISSPVDGSIAGSPVGDNVGFTSVTRAIDGRYVVTSSQAKTLCKLDEAGSITWAYHHTLEGETKPAPPFSVAHTRDTDMLLLSRNETGTELALIKIAQDGKARSASKIRMPEDLGCTPTPRGIASDGDRGAYLAGSCVERGLAWVAHVTQAGVVTRMVSLFDREVLSMRLTMMVVVDGEVVVGGTLTPAASPEEMFVARLRSDGSVVFSQRYQGCASSPDFSPTSGVAGDNGDVTLAGSGGGHHNGFVARLRSDGSVGWASFPGLSFGVADVFVINNIVELPTTGYVVAGSTAQYGGETGLSRTPAIGVAGLDAVGHLLWSQRYSLGSEALDALRPSGFPGLALSDDGGVVLGGLAQGVAPAEGELWAIKAYAKDGFIDFASENAQTSSLSLLDLECTLSALPWAPEVSELAPASEPVEVVSEKVELSAKKP